MKKIWFLALLFLVNLGAIAQVTDAFNYQAVIRDNNGDVIADQNIGVKISILKDSEEGAPVYSESHEVKTSQLGVLNLKVGSGTLIDGNFSTIDWGSTNFYLDVSIDKDGGTEYTSIGVFQLLSVPYAFYSKKAENSEYAVSSESSQEANHALNSENAVYSDTADVAKKLDEEVLYFTNTDTLFAVKDREGNIVFAVYPDGAKIYVNEGVKGRVGGFAVTGRNPTKASSEEDYMIITADSTRIYIPESATKGKVGGFAVTGRNPTKGDISNDYFNISGINSSDFDTIDPSEPRMVWYPKSEAFLVGRVLIESPDSVGLNSVATGFESKAIGNYSQALGYQSIARNDYSTAIGKNAIAEGAGSYAFGDNALTKSSADNSYAIGSNATAQGYNSYAFGNGTIADGDGSFAFGAGGRDSTGAALSTYTIAGGDNSFAMGLGAVAYGLNSFSIGTGNYIASTGENAVAIGFENVAAGRYAIALGYRNQSTGISSMTWGGIRSGTTDYTNIASGRASTAWGFKTVASGSQSTAWGQYTEATGTNSTAFGMYAKATGYNSTAWGRGSEANESYSTAFGLGSIADAYQSIAFGEDVKSTSFNATVIGRKNDTIYKHTDINHYDNRTPYSYIGWYNDDPLFIVGNGSYNHEGGRKNALTILKDGTTIVGWRSDLTNTTENPDIRYNASVLDPRTNNYLFYVHGNAGGKSAWINESDERLKKNINTIDNALDKVLKLRGVSFEWKDTTRKGQNIGFIAQEAKEVIPEVVTGSEETQYSMQYASITAVLVEAVKEQQSQIEKIQSDNQALKKENEELKQKLDEIIKLLKVE